MRIYIAGAVEEVNYRTYVHKHYTDKFDILDPLKEIEPRIHDIDVVKWAEKKTELSDDVIKKIVEIDKEAILTCDCMVVYMVKYTAGTIMEILFAYEHNIPVYVIDPREYFRKDVWIKYHSTEFFTMIDGAFDYIQLGM